MIFPSNPIFPIAPFPSFSNGLPSRIETYKNLAFGSKTTASGNLRVESVCQIFSKECCADKFEDMSMAPANNIFFTSVVFIKSSPLVRFENEFVSSKDLPRKCGAAQVSSLQTRCLRYIFIYFSITKQNAYSHQDEKKELLCFR